MALHRSLSFIYSYYIVYEHVICVSYQFYTQIYPVHLLRMYYSIRKLVDTIYSCFHPSIHLSIRCYPFCCSCNWFWLEWLQQVYSGLLLPTKLRERESLNLNLNLNLFIYRAHDGGAASDTPGYNEFQAGFWRSIFLMLKFAVCYRLDMR